MKLDKYTKGLKRNSIVMNNIDRTRLSNKMTNRIYVSQMLCSDIISF